MYNNNYAWNAHDINYFHKKKQLRYRVLLSQVPPLEKNGVLYMHWELK